MKRVICSACGTLLGNDDIALNLKLVSRSTGRFYCLPCLALRLQAQEAELAQLRDFFKTNGCELFAQRYVNE